jgi:hypothetical protein
MGTDAVSRFAPPAKASSPPHGVKRRELQNSLN